MKAVIMAGGAGKRLRPLTETIPKPMVRLCGKPVVDYIIELLYENDVDECVAALGYQAQVLCEHLSEGARGMKISCVVEQEPLGTAGSVRHAARTIQLAEDEPLLVISGDALCDFALRDAVEAHRRNAACVTIVTARVNDPREYGLVVANKNGQIRGFVEKPSYAQATSELANTGIYILSARALDMIPVEKKYDFAQDLFPRLLLEGERMLACTLEGYWCDIGDLQAYRRAQSDLLAGRVKGFIVEEANPRPSGRYELIQPVYIGAGVRIGSGAVVGPNTVLDDGCTVAAGAQVIESIMLPRSVLGERARADGAILGVDAAVKPRGVLHMGAALGAGAVVGCDAVVRPNVRLESGARLPDKQTASVHLSAQSVGMVAFDDDGLRGEVGIDLTPELAVRVGCALGSLAKGGAVGVASCEGSAGSVLAAAVIAGIRSTGASVMNFGVVFESMFGFAMGYNTLMLGVYMDVNTPAQGAFKVVCDAGLPATRRLEREIEQLLGCGEFIRAPRDAFGDQVDMSGIGVIYLSELRRLAPDGLSETSARVSSQNKGLQRMLGELLTQLGCEEASNGIQLHVSADGRRLSMREGETCISAQRVVAAYGLLLFQEQQDMAVENDFPRTLDLFAEKWGRRVYRYLLSPADDSDAQSRRLAAQQCARDGLMLAVVLLGYMKKRGYTLAQLDHELPEFAVEQADIPINQPPAQLLGKLASEQAGEGMLVRDARGVVLLRPRKTGGAIRVFAEAANWETARELCADLSGQINRLLDKRTQKD